MAAVTTERLMQIALEMAGMPEIPPDSRVEYAGTRISHILFGIDVGPAELFMARQLGFHAVIAQRPYAVPAGAWRLYDWHRVTLQRLGVSVPDVEDIQRGVPFLHGMALNGNQDVIPSVARLVETPMVTIASPLDMFACKRVQQMADDLVAAKPEATVGNLRDALLALPEFAAGQAKPWIIQGAEDVRLGRVLVLPGGLAAPSFMTVDAYAKAGITTLASPEAFGFAPQLAKRSSEGNMRVLITGRIATASLGSNPYIARLRAEGLEVHTFAGVLPSEQ